MTVVGIIPARYASMRFPGKPLANLLGLPMIQHVYQRACKAKLLEEVLVATDDFQILDTVIKFGGEAVMTDTAHSTGTDRLAEVARRLTGADIIVNIQGDEPLVDPNAIDAVVRALRKTPDAPMSSAMAPLPDPELARDPNIVKVVTNNNGMALYFSRAPIPYPREGINGLGPWKKHIGLYAYRRDFLLTFASLPATPLEQMEKLEQLRALEHGYAIKMVQMSRDNSIGVDTPADLERVRATLEQMLQS